MTEKYNSRYSEILLDYSEGCPFLLGNNATSSQLIDFKTFQSPNFGLLFAVFILVFPAAFLRFFFCS